MTTATSSDEGEVVVESKSRSWSSETNWTVSGGSIDSLITVESLDSPIDFEAVDANENSPLVLIPPSFDSSPCEIKINFAQKHEVRQVYVRSTARIFEIYLAPSLSSNEYLCTVRCGIAARDDEVLHATQTGEHDGADSNGFAGEQAKGRSKNDGNIPANEDDWIEVKVPDSSSQDNQQNSIPRNADYNQEASSQDLYEATAEITDVDACISLTLRLLSLQTKEWVYIDEIYIFADPVDSADTETQVPEVGSSAGTSLMAMLVPTLLNLSRSGNIQKQNKQTFDPKERDESLGVGIHVPHPTFTAVEIQQEAIDTQQEVNEDAHKSPNLQTPGQAADAGQDPKLVSNMPCDQIARTLELLLSRVSRIEDICSSFEQSMLKPISSIEGRLQRVEEQVQMLSKNAQRPPPPPCPSTRIAAPSFSCTETDASAFNDEESAENVQPPSMPPCPSTRISAPSFSCSGTNSSPLNTEAKNYPACRALQSEKKDSPVEVSSNPHVDLSIPVYDTRFIPSFVVTAPEFSCGDDEESDDDLEPKEDCPKEIKKQALSVDDALASALAGLLSATSTRPSHYIQTLTVKAPEFIVDEDGDDRILASPSAQSVQTPPSHYIPTLTVKTPEFTVDEDEDDCILALPSGQSGLNVALSSVPYESDPPRYVNDSASSTSSVPVLPDNFLEDTSGGVTEKVQFDDEDTHGHGCSRGITIDSKGEATDVSIVSNSETSDILQQFPGVPVEDTFKNANGSAAGTVDDVVEGSEEATSKGKAMNASIVSNSEISDILQQFPGVPIEDTCKTANGSAAETAADVEEGSEEDVSVDVVVSSSTSCTVDFEFPILDVKFASSGLVIADSPVEADVPEKNVEAPCLLQRDVQNLLVDWDDYYVSDVPAGTEGEGSENAYACEQEASSSLI